RHRRNSPPFPYTTLFRAGPARPRRRVAVRPAEPLGALPQARDEVAGAERQAALRLPVGLVADAQLDGVDPGGDGQLVHDRFERVDRKSTRLNSSHVKISY